MQVFTVEGMTCGGCAGSVTRAVQQADKNARVEVDLATKTVKVKARCRRCKSSMQSPMPGLMRGLRTE